jgi:hypothetical protein
MIEKTPRQLASVKDSRKSTLDAAVASNMPLFLDEDSGHLRNGAMSFILANVRGAFPEGLIGGREVLTRDIEAAVLRIRRRERRNG